MSNILGFFSSDSRPLYQDDIYRSLALPEKSIIHVRYAQKYIQNEIATDYMSYTGQQGIMFFVAGNFLGIPNDERDKKFYSLRNVTVRDITISKDTKHFHFHLELGDFRDCKIRSTEDKKFVSKITIEDGIANSWIERVEAVKDHFGKVLFFKFALFKENGKILNPTYDKLTKEAVFKLEEETVYRLKFSFYDKQEGESSLLIHDSPHYDVHYKESSNIGAVVDDRSFRLVTNTINQGLKPDILKIFPSPIPKGDKLKYEVISYLQIQKGIKNTFFFALFSCLGFFSIVLAQTINVLIDKQACWVWIVAVMLVAIINFGFAGALLYNKFNKK